MKSEAHRLTSWLRTVIPAVWSALVAYLATLGAPRWLTEPLGGLGQTVFVPIVLGAVYAFLRWVEPRLPAWLRRLLLGSTRQPVYEQHTAVATGQ